MVLWMDGLRPRDKDGLRSRDNDEGVIVEVEGGRVFYNMQRAHEKNKKLKKEREEVLEGSLVIFFSSMFSLTFPSKNFIVYFPFVSFPSPPFSPI